MYLILTDSKVFHALPLSLFPIGEDDPHWRLSMFRPLTGKEKSFFHIADDRACQY